MNDRRHEQTQGESWWALVHVPTANVLDEQPTREDIEEVMAEFLHTDPGQNPEHFRIVEMP